MYVCVCLFLKASNKEIYRFPSTNECRSVDINDDKAENVLQLNVCETCAELIIDWLRGEKTMMLPRPARVHDETMFSRTHARISKQANTRAISHLQGSALFIFSFNIHVQSDTPQNDYK